MSGTILSALQIIHFGLQKLPSGEFPGGPVVKTVLPLQGARAWSLGEELSSHMPRGTAKTQTNKNNPLR